MSTMPGARVRPRASIRSRAAPRSPPTAVMRPRSTATPPARGGPPRPSITTALSMTRSCVDPLAMHHEPAVDAERLAGHVRGARRGQEADDGRDVLRALHAAERDGLAAPARELLGRLAEQRALLARHRRPHVGLDEARAHAVGA